MDKSGANKSAIDQIIGDREIKVEVRQVKYLNHIVEQDHRAFKLKTSPMPGFKSFHAAANVLAGIELMHLIRKGQMEMPGCEALSFAGQVRPAERLWNVRRCKHVFWKLTRQSHWIVSG